MPGTDSTKGNQPDRFSVSINGFNLFQNIPQLEIRRNTFLVGPNGSGKSTFLRLLPLFALPERVHLPTLADKGFSIGHFLSQQEMRSPVVSSDPADEYEAPRANAHASTESLINPPSTKVQIIVDFLIPRDYWVDLPIDLISELKEFQKRVSEFHSGRDTPSALRQLTALLARIQERADNGPHSSGTGGLCKVRLSGEYSRSQRWINRDSLTIQLMLNDEWSQLYSSTTEVVSVHKLSWFTEFRYLPELLLQGVDADGQIGPLRAQDGTLIDEKNSPELGSWDVKAIDLAIHTAIEQTFHPVSWPAPHGREVRNWLLSFFTKPITEFFGDTRLADLTRIDANPVLKYETDDIGTLVSPAPEDEVSSSLVSYWLQYLGIGESLRVDDLGGDGWRLQIRRMDKWLNVASLGAGLSRFTWLLFLLSRVRTGPISELKPSLLNRVYRRFPFILERTQDAETRREMARRITSDLLLKPRILAVEEPENRLHPRLQTYIADIILNVWDTNSTITHEIVAKVAKEIEDVLELTRAEQADIELQQAISQRMRTQLDLHFCGEKPAVNATIVETHSEYLIRRIQSLVAHNRTAPEDIIIHYFSGGGSEQQHAKETSWPIEINPDGTLSRDFGPGFFGEAASLIDDLWQAWKPKS